MKRNKQLNVLFDLEEFKVVKILREKHFVNISGFVKKSLKDKLEQLEKLEDQCQS